MSSYPVLLTYLPRKAITAVGKGFVVTEVSYGLGQHRSQLSVGQYQQYLKYDFLDWAQFFIALLVTKISICLFLTRLSQFHRLRAVLYGLMGFLFVTHIPLFFIYVFQCSPVRRAWQRDVGGKCMSKDVVENVIIAQGGGFNSLHSINLADLSHQSSPSLRTSFVLFFQQSYCGMSKSERRRRLAYAF